ncbi:MAG: GGDEF domain-containing protein [bacterium]
MHIDEKTAKLIFSHVSDGIVIRNSTTGVEYWNSTMEMLTGYSLEEVEGKTCNQALMHTNESGDFLCKTDQCPYSKAMQSGSISTDFLYIKHKSGHRFPVISTIIKVLDDNGQLLRFIEIIKNKSNEFFYQEKIKDLQNLALIDPLTRIPNRRYIEEEIKKHMEKSDRESVKSAIIFIDIDNFKQFNDTYGHNAGDRLLVNVARTLLNSVRKYDIVGRWGGEEFVALIEDVNNEELRFIAEKILKLIRGTSIIYNGREIGCTVSIGADFIDRGISIEKNIERADMLMYQSKKRGKNSFTVG